MSASAAGSVDAASAPWVSRLGQLWWCRVPARLARWSRALGLMTVEGSYVVAWPGLAAAAPPLLALVGLIVGAAHPLMADALYSSSLLVLVLLALPGQFGAGFGIWTVIGYAIGDFVINRRAGTFSGCFECGPLADIVQVRLPMVLSYLLLAGLVVGVPFLATTLRRLTLGRLERSGQSVVLLRCVGQAVSQGVLVSLWTTVFPPLIRPFFTWTNGSPDIGAISPVQVDGWVLVGVGVASGAVRVLVEARALARPGAAATIRGCLAGVSRTLPRRWPRIPYAVRVVLTGGLLTLLFAGLIDGWVEAVLLFAVFTGSTFLRSVVGRFARWSKAIGRVPIVLRLAIGAAASYVITLVVLGQSGLGQSFLPIVVASGLSLPITALLLPTTPGPGAPPLGAATRPPRPGVGEALVTAPPDKGDA